MFKRKNVKSGEIIYVDSESGKCFERHNCMGDTDYWELKDFCITNDWKKVLYN